MTIPKAMASGQSIDPPGSTQMSRHADFTGAGIGSLATRSSETQIQIASGPDAARQNVPPHLFINLETIDP
jgi:hypothetical protein